MTLHKLTAGDGYTYLTRQVAAQDATARGFGGLGDYYAQRGESPGVWMGSGVAGLPQFSGGPVTEEQMTALFGEGRHPDAARIEVELRAAGHGDPVILAATRLGSPFIVYDAANPFRTKVAQAFGEHNAALGLRRDWPVPAEDRAAIRTRVARAMFATEYGRAPAEARELSGFLARISRQATTAVAGYDLTFSPVKSVSALWAIADRPVAEVIEQAHHDAVADTLAWLERTAVYTRRGRHGVAQVETNGLIAAGFTHRDSRAGDPDLHTHVAVSNKVAAREDGRWLALDGRPLHQAAVAASERYNTRVEALLVERLGVRFADRPGTAEGKRAVREIVGIDVRLTNAWSRRRAAIDARRAELAATFQIVHGRAPTAVEAIALAQQANLETRHGKHEPRSQAQQRTAWQGDASTLLGDEQAVRAMLKRVLHPAHDTAGRPLRVTERWVQDAADQVLAVVQAGRACWQECHVRAEAERHARNVGVPAAQLDAAVDAVAAEALSPARSIRLGVQDPVSEPGPLRRSDGTSVYQSAGSQLYTSPSIISAEQQLLAAAARRDGRTVPPAVIELALLEAVANGVELNPGQAQLVRELAGSPARVQLALAPAGTGKTTAMRVVARAWTTATATAGSDIAPGAPVVGLAPSAAAAAVLREQTGIASDTIAKLLHGIDTDRLPDWAVNIRTGSLVVIDEAAMAGTADLAHVVDFVLHRGGSVRLIGDDQQLASVAAGGALRDIAATHGAVHLSQVLRFTDPAEGAASIALRAGEPAALGYYLDQHRVHVGDQSTAPAQAYAAWATDRAAGRDALLLAPTRELVAALNTRAQADRHAATGAPADPQIRLADGTHAGAGDVIITRRNERRLPITATDWVKNGDRWTITDAYRDGALRVVHHGTGRHLTLPPDYAAKHVALGYASTVHAAQGATAETCHLVATGTETRQLLYVGLTRGRTANHVYLATTGAGDPHTVIERDTLLPPTPVEVLTRVLARDGAHSSATSTATALADPAVRLHEAALRYHDALLTAATTHLGAGRLAELDRTAEHAVSGLTAAAAWDTLRGRLALLSLDGHDPGATLRTAVAQRSLDGAGDLAAVLDWRLESTGARSPALDPLSWLPAVPAALLEDPQWGRYLTARAALVTDLADQVATRTRDWTPTTAPGWATGLLDADPSLLAELAVWRAATDVPDNDRDPVGPPVRYAAEARHQQQLTAQLARLFGDPHTAAAHWRSLAEQIDPRLPADPYWPRLANRLSAAHRAGIDITTLTRTVAADRPLPDEHPAAALWWRLSRQLSPTVLAADVATVCTLRPHWTPVLLNVLGEHTAQRILADPAWPALVAAVSTAGEHGWTPEQMLTTGYQLLDAAQRNDDAPLRADEVATAMVWHIGMLTDVPPDPQLPPDPATEPDPGTGDAPPGAPADLAVLGEAGTDGGVEEHWFATLQPPADDHGVDEPSRTPTGAREVVWVADDGEHDALYAYPAHSGVPADRLVELNSQALAYYRRCYPNSWAHGYLAERLGAELAGHAEARYHPGYAPPGWDHLITHLHRLGATDAELLAAGLASRARTGQLVDRFRDRLVFPIWHQDQLHGFIARRNPTHDSDSHAGPKYLNTPETDLFGKGAQLFGLHEARDLLTAGAAPVLVEGPLDTLAVTLASGGRFAGVAPLGTAFTDRQADQLRAWIGDGKPGVLVATDNDPAGRHAAERAYWQLTARGDNPHRPTLPDGLDPADLLRVSGPAALQSALAEAGPLAATLIDARIDRYAGRLDEPESRVAAVRAAAEIIGALPPPHWAEHIDHVQTRVDPVPGVVHLEVIDAGHAWAEDPYAAAHRRLAASSDPHRPATERWAPLGRAIHPDLITGRDWQALAAALDRAQVAGYEVESSLLRLAATAPLPYRAPARELHDRLAADCPEAATGVAPIARHADQRAADTTPTTRPARRNRQPDTHHDATAAAGPDRKQPQPPPETRAAAGRPNDSRPSQPR